MEITKEIARKIGSKEAFIATGTALVIDLILILFLWLENGFPQKSHDAVIPTILIVFGITLVFFGQLFGRTSGSAILLMKRPYGWVGALCAVGTLACATSTTALVALPFVENWPNHTWGMLKILSAYVFGSAIVTFMYSAVILIPHGIIFGYRIYRRGQKLAS